MSAEFELRLVAIERGGNDAVACIVFKPKEEGGPRARQTFHGHLFERPVKETDGRAIFDGEMRAKGEDDLPADGVLVLFASPTSGPLRVKFTGDQAYLENEDGTEDATQPLDRLDPDTIVAEYNEAAKTLRLRRKR